MQTLALENYGTTELSLNEQRQTDGGWLLPVLIGLAEYFLLESASNPNASSQALQSGYNAGRK